MTSQMTSRMLPLSEYGPLVQLAEPFAPPQLAPVGDANESAARLLAALGHGDRTLPPLGRGLTARQALYAALIARPARPFPPQVLEALDLLLAAEAAARPRVESSTLPDLGDGLSLWQGDITTLRCDAIVNAGNSALLGCFQPFHACIDNAIHAAAGPRLRADCHTIMERQQCPEETGGAKLTRGYHLPSRYVLHTVGPLINGGDPERVSAAQRAELAACYRSCLELAQAVPEIRTLAFPCIATGVFGFPARPAAAIAVETVRRWLSQHPARFSRVVFNVFSNRDERIYQSLLLRSQS